MKKLFVTFLILLFSVSVVYAGFTGTSTPYYNRATGKLEGFIVHIICTNSSPATAQSSSIDTMTGISSYNLSGTKLHNVKVYPGATAPTDASDLEIIDPYGIDLLGGKGTDLIDSTSKTQTLVGPSGAYAPQRSIGTKSIIITNDSVNSSVTNFILDFVTN